LPHVTGGIAGVLDRGLRERPDAVAVLARSGSLTYAELDAVADRAAAALWGLGLRPGDRLAASLPNDLDVVVAFHGAMRIGLIWVGIGEGLAAAEKRQLLAHCAPRVVIGSAEVIEQLKPAQQRLAYWPVVAGGEHAEWSRLLSAGGNPPRIDVDPAAPAGIAYTSGTTGEPKGIVHSQHNLLLPGEVLVATRGWGPELRKGDCLPLTILNMLVLTTLLTAQAAGCCVIMDRRDADGIAEWIRDGSVTHWNGVPAQLHDLVAADRVESDALASLHEVWSGGGDCPDSLRARFAEVYGLQLRSTYGLTEAPTVVAIDPVGDARQPGASGQVLPHLDVAAYADDGARLPAGDTGELRITSRRDGEWAGRWTPYLGVWQDWQVVPYDSAVVATGDIGSVDTDGWVRIVDRLKVLIIRGGANVYPAEVERVLTAHDAVAGAAVFGVPDERLGERVAALIQLRPDADVTVAALRAEVAGQLAKYKVPERWGIVSELPRNAMGKVVRTELPQLLLATEGSTR
jgi:acyl-CoA synthetase (AMP-forming)/AMP-acid ligase II